MAKVLIQERRKREIVILDPTGGVGEEARPRALRLQNLEGRTVGLLSDDVQGSTPFLERLGELLQSKYQVGRAVLKIKPNLSRPTPLRMLDELLREVDALVVGVGL